MFIGNPPGNHDRVLDFSTAVTGTLFFVPSADLLERSGRCPPLSRTPTVSRRRESEPVKPRRIAGHRRSERSIEREPSASFARADQRSRLGAAGPGGPRAPGACPRRTQAASTSMALTAGSTQPRTSAASRRLTGRSRAHIADGVTALRRRVLPLVELRADFASPEANSGTPTAAPTIPTLTRWMPRSARSRRRRAPPSSTAGPGDQRRSQATPHSDSQAVSRPRLRRRRDRGVELLLGRGDRRALRARRRQDHYRRAAPPP